METGQTKEIRQLLNLQFKMIGENITFEEIPENGMMIIDKKKVHWFKLYKFKDEEQYLKWKQELYKVEDLTELQLDMIDMVFGLDYNKEGGH